MTQRTPLSIASLIVLGATMGGCVVPADRLGFPTAPIRSSADERAYDVDGDGRVDFRLTRGESGKHDVLAYDDDQDGVDDRIFRLSDYSNEETPHLIILLDSVPFDAVADRWATASWTWFDPPVKVIPPFPTMSGVIFTRMLHAPPLPGMINQYYSRTRNTRINGIWARVSGARNPWEERLHYKLKYWQNGLAFLNPRAWWRAELARAKDAFDASGDRVTLVYIASSAAMLSKHGRQGLDEVLCGLDQLCMQLLFERQGAVKISALADHGHTLIPGKRIDVPGILRDAGFKPRDGIHHQDDVVVELNGLVNYAGVHTRRAADVARALVSHTAIEFAMYMEGDSILVSNAAGQARVERRADRFRYTPVDRDVLEYRPVIESLRAAGRIDTDGFASDRDWFDATVDHQWPDAPRRLWDAFHGLARSTPDVMITTRCGYCVGLPSMERFITMASTHGGLSQIDSATFLLTMTGRSTGPLRTGDVLSIIEPTFDLGRRP